MEIFISKNTKINDIKNWFSTKFQQLKIEFFLDQDHDGKFTKEEMIIDNEIEIGNIRELDSDGMLKITRRTTVSTLEKIFHDNFGVNVEVFRRSGSLWLLTTATDNLTLIEQNELAASSLKQNIEPQPDYRDLSDLE